MVEGAPDYVHLRQILAKDALGNLVPVACDPSGRVILLPYGTQTVSQDDPTRTIQGSDGLDLYTIAVDAAGRLIMLPYGWDGATYRPLKVDDEGRMIGVMKGQADVKWGLRGWWKFIASEGATIKDYSGYGNNGSALSGVAAEAKYEDGVIGQALEFDGVDDYYSVVDDDSLDITTHITLESWLYRTEIDVRQFLLVSTTRLLLQWLADNKISFRFYEDGVGWATAHNTSEAYDDVNTWVHLIITYNAVSVKIYINGSEVYTNDDDSGKIIGTPASSFIFGIYDDFTTDPFKGLMDEIRIYARALSADEVSWRYANTNPAVGKPTRMIAVDNEGRMEVNLKDLPYKGQVLKRTVLPGAGGASVSISTSTVPQGKVWVITKAIAYTDTAALDSIDIGIYDGVDNYIIAACREVDSCIKSETNNDMILKAGDKISAGFGGLPANWVVGVTINGYELDAP